MRSKLVYTTVALGLTLLTAAIATGQVRVSAAATKRTPRIFACYKSQGSVIKLMAGRMPKCPSGQKLLSWDAGTAVAPAGLIISGQLPNGGSPSDAVGNVGDYFLDLFNNRYQLWGPKLASTSTGGTWVGAANHSLIGPKGDTGATGPKGDTGATGPSGISGYHTNTQPATVGVGTATLTVQCNQGSPLGGGEDNSAGGDVVLLKSFPTPSGWTVAVHNGSTNGTPHTVTAWVVCASVSN